MKKMKFQLYFLITLSLFLSQASTQSLQDLGKMKAEYEKLRNSQSTLNPQINNEASATGNNLPNEIDIIPFKDFKLVNDSLVRINKFFGYNYFTNRDTISFYGNLPPPKNYMLGPGDEVIITLWGETQLRQSYTISRNGDIYDDKVGLLSLTGKNIDEAKKYLISQFGRVFSTLKSKNALTYMDVSLGSLKLINVNIVGEVKYPGIYPVHPFSNLITSIIQAGGVDTTGSLRNIKIKRDKKIFSTVDLYSYLINGDISSEIQLRDNDIIVVPVRMNEITIDSGVVKPAIYEFKPGETINDIISYSGGLKPNSSSQISIKRIAPKHNVGIKKQTTETYYIDFKDSDNILAQNGDVLSIADNFIEVSHVEIIGQVKKPGKYNFFDGMNLQDLLSLSSGFDDTTFWKSVYSTGQIVRRNPNNRYEKIINVDFSNLNTEDIAQNIPLNNLDRVLVHANLNFFEKKNVKVYGEVNIPGSYPLISDNESLESVLNRSGGLTSKALKNGISIFRDREYFDNLKANKISDDENDKTKKIRVAWTENTVSLMPGDSIIVKESTKTVLIAGQVQNPGLVEFNKGKNIRYYINSAGGLNSFANRKSIILIEPNGMVKPNKWYTTPAVTDGSTIFVGKKEITEPFDITQFVTNWTQIVSSLITAVILSQQIGSS
tara:strand:- start:23558 stop:25543 length:1986 start_codon:yes stop_codon:yes gene_type:complete